MIWQAHRPWSLMRWLSGFGLPGLLVYSMADASPLPMPGGGVDVLTIVLAARHDAWWGYYALLATLGAVAGGAMSYAVAERSGAALLQKRVGTARTAALAAKVARRGWPTLFLSSLMPPPFPFTVVVLAAGAARLPRAKFLSALTLGRLLRFGIAAYLGSLYGRSIIRQMRRYQPTPAHIAAAAVVLAVVVGAVVLAYRHYHVGSPAPKAPLPTA